MDVHCIWMYTVYGCTPYMDVHRIWMYTEYGFTPYMDVHLIWMYTVYGCCFRDVASNGQTNIEWKNSTLVSNKIPGEEEWINLIGW